MENKDMFIMSDSHFCDRLGQRARKIFVQTALEDSISSHGTESSQNILVSAPEMFN